MSNKQLMNNALQTDVVKAKGARRFTEEHVCDVCGNRRKCYEKEIARDGKEIHICQECLDKNYRTLAIISEGFPHDPIFDVKILAFCETNPPTIKELEETFADEDLLYTVYIGMDYHFYGAEKDRVAIQQSNLSLIKSIEKREYEGGEWLIQTFLSKLGEGEQISEIEKAYLQGWVTIAHPLNEEKRILAVLEALEIPFEDKDFHRSTHHIRYMPLSETTVSNLALHLLHVGV